MGKIESLICLDFPQVFYEPSEVVGICLWVNWPFHWFCRQWNFNMILKHMNFSHALNDPNN
jgi:hypothetical protein